MPELQALTGRAPLDLRVNALKVQSRSEAHDALPHLGAVETPLSPYGLRIQPGEDGRGPAVQSEPEFIKGWIEIQDEGSQIAAILSGVQPDEQVVDLCAGGGGKTLALAAMMNNHGQLYATDSDARRLAPIHERVTRAGVRNVQIRTPRARADAVSDLDGKIDCVVVDAPCTGIGTWRRNPDAKWRLRPGSLDVRRNEQAVVLDRAAGAGQIRRADRLHHVLDPAGGERRGGFGLPRPARRFHAGRACRRCWPGPRWTSSRRSSAPPRTGCR